MSQPRRIVNHWSAGHLEHALAFYNFCIDRDGSIVPGKFPPEAQCIRPLLKDRYAPHVKAANGDTIGVSMIGMWDAVSPAKLGTAPLTAKQWQACVDLNAKLCADYGITPSKQTIVGHCEVERLWGIPQDGKWDPWVAMPEWTWAKGMTPQQIGDYFREAVAAKSLAAAKAS